ncbi:menaquinone biosynthetic enzyme MqnA/MqnD family protein [Planctomicrobium sp. SH661]|uniref:menaquinone biosynthetic enzyme MqnA/MqnD family protein n=1 Tax=Planctomicrobium sp. SH661 TaxID=3448124 RepID=UPI003F5C6CAD
MIDRNRASHMDGNGQRTRIGAVTYLNSKPLVEGLVDLCPQASVLLDYPSRLADGLAHATLDVALIPSVEAFCDPDYEVVSDACVATHGPVFSVKLYFRKHPGDVKTLALDEGSRTSAALARVMLEERFGVQPKLQRLPIGKTIEDASTDAVLLIGDRAMSPQPGEFHTVWDLGEEWVNWTGLPFVFAMWVARKDSQLDGIPQQLNAARNLGLNRIDKIAQRGAQSLNLPVDMVKNYLTKNLHFTMGSAEQMGLRLFQELAAAHGLAGAVPLSFRTDFSSAASEELVASQSA